jgi:hypothetical protein
MFDWQRLGLEGPTQDARIIKRAYARALRHARPDDDAVAYQSLREAYDRLLHGAQRAEAGAGAAADGEHDLPFVDTAPDAPLRIEVAEAGVPGPGAAPPALCARLLDAQARGPGAVDALLPELRRELAALPLQWRPLASTLFADLVLQTPDLPPAAKRLLQEHFAWLEDFRAGKLLGTRRLEALSAAIGVLRPPLSDPRILQTYADTLALHALIERQRRLAAALLAALLGPALERQFDEAGTGLLARLGLDPPRRERLRRTIGYGQALRVATVGLVVLLACLACAPGAGAALGDALQLGWIGWVGPRACARALRWLALAQRPGTRLGRLPWRRLRPWWPWIGVLILVVAAGMMSGPQAVADEAHTAIGAALAVLGVALAMPRQADAGIAAAALAAYLALWLAPAPPGATLLALAWAMAVILGSQRRKPWGEVDYSSSWRHLGRGLPFALLVPVFGMPWYIVVVAARAGYPLVVAGLLLACVPALAPRAPGAIVALPAAVGAIAGMLALRLAARDLARRWSARCAPGGDA